MRNRDFDILIAQPEKAFIDYLYFMSYRNNKFHLKDERLDREAILKMKRKKLNKYAQLYKLNIKELYAEL